MRITFCSTQSETNCWPPLGAVGGVTSDNILKQRFSKSPALADAVRALIGKQAGDRGRSDVPGGGHSSDTDRQPAARQRDLQVALVV